MWRAEPGKTPLQRCTEQSASHARRRGEWKCQLRKEPGVDAESQRRRTEQASAAALRLLLAPASPPPPPLSSRNSCWSPTPRRARAAPRPCPPPPIHRRRARALPGEKLPRWPGVNRHSGQRTKGKASHKAGRCGSRGLVSRSPAEPSCEKRRWRPGGRPSVPAGLAGPQLPPPVRPGPAEVASGLPHAASPPQGRRRHTRTHTLTRTPARPPARGRWSRPPPPALRSPGCSAPTAAALGPHPARTRRELRCT